MAKKATEKIEETTAAVAKTPVEAAAKKTAEVKTEVKAEEKKAEPAKTTARKTSAKKVETAVKDTAAKAEKAVKSTAAKTEKAAKSTAAKVEKAVKKTTKTTAKAAEPTTDVYVQYLGKEIVCKDILAKVKEIWKNDLGKKEADIKDIKVYIKPEDNGAYYVVNGDITGFVSL